MQNYPKNKKPRLECPSCRKFYSISQAPHQMNFTKGIVHYHCRSCHREIFQMSFKQWNASHLEQPKENNPPRREDQKRRRFGHKKKSSQQEKKPGAQNPSNRFYQSNLPR